MKKFLTSLVLALSLLCSVSSQAAVKPWCNFVLAVQGDGSTTTQVFNLLSDPFVLASGYGMPTGTSALTLTFDATSVLPTGVEVTSTNGPAISSITLGLLGAVTIVWSSPIGNGTDVVVNGKLIY